MSTDTVTTSAILIVLIWPALVVAKPRVAGAGDAVVARRRDVERPARRKMGRLAGRPGAGKTYALEAVVAAHIDAGVPIVGCAVSAAAAAVTLLHLITESIRRRISGVALKDQRPALSDGV